MDVREDLSPVSYTVAIIILKNDQRVVHLLEWFPLRVGVPASRPEPALAVNLHLHGIGEVLKHLLRGKYVELIALRHLDFGRTFLGAQVVNIAFLVST